jgi:hypothetical protein
MLRVFLYAAFVLLLGVDAAIFMKTGAPEPRVACGSEYTVEPGDTLYDIAKWAYGDPLMYREIYDANGDLLRDERTIDIGDKILIPCLDDADARSRPDAEAPELAAEVEKLLAAPVGSIADNKAISQPTGERIRFLTGSDFTPFTDKNLIVGGIITDLVTRTMSAAGFSHQLHQ